MKKLFRIFLEIRPGVLIGNPYNIVLPQGEMYLEELQDSVAKRPIGLRFVLTMSSDSLDNAIGPAKGFTRGILSLLSYMTNAGLPEPIVMKAYEITPGEKISHFRQYHYDIPADTFSIRDMDRDLLKKAITGFNVESHSLRISRALHWYRIGILSTDVLDRYVALWTSLETLNIILIELYNLEVEMGKCPDCGRETVPIPNGIRTLVNDLFSDKKKIWRRLRETRASIVHGFRTFADITPEARELLPYLEKSVEKALDEILNLKGIVRKPSIQLDHPHPIYSQVDVTISGPDIGLLDEHVEPSFDAGFSFEGVDSTGQTFRTTRSQSLDERFTVKEIKHVFHTMEHVASGMDFHMDTN
ncbi:MAG: hypothetical protein ACFFER_02670 [Candidatus Thorarchaeota archaeon]